MECRREYKYENSQHLEISRIYVNGKCPYPRAKMNGKCPTPRAQKTGKSPTLSRGTLGDSLDTSIRREEKLERYLEVKGIEPSTEGDSKLVIKKPTICTSAGS